MREIDYENTKCIFKVKYDDGFVLKGSINYDQTSINSKSELAKLILKHEVNDELEIITGDRVAFREKFIILEKKVKYAFKEVINMDKPKHDLNNMDGYQNIKNVEKLNATDIFFMYIYKSSEKYIPKTTSNFIINTLKKGPYCNDKHAPKYGYRNEFNKMYNIFNKYFIERFGVENKGCVLCGVPSHLKSEKNDNPVALLLRRCCYEDRFIDGTNCLIRYIEIESQKKVKTRYQTTHLESIKINNKELIKDKIVILVDDIVTSGSTMKACKQILLSNGAKKVICFAFAKDWWEK